MKAGSWPAILGVYLFGIAAGATVPKLVPLSADFARDFGMSPVAFGGLFSLIAIPAALLAIPSGVVVDRFGARATLIGGALVAALANLIYFSASSVMMLGAARLIEGAAIVHIYTAGPAMLMGMTEGQRRTAGLSVWTTYMPVGTSAAFAFFGFFADGPGWRTAFLGHGALFLIAAAIGLILPKVGAGPVRRTFGAQLLELKSAYARPPLLLLAIAFFLMICIGLGANTAFPIYFAHVLGLSMGQASSMVAATTLIMVPGSLLTGAALAKGMKPTAFFAVIAATGLVVGTFCFVPTISLSARYLMLGCWYLCSGASVATLMATLPLIAEPARRGAAAALLNQAAALATFVSPPIWLAYAAGTVWTPFSLLLAIGWGGGVLALWGATSLSGRAARAV
jgi:predicted MFS family arabinose efflux permease